MVIIDKLKIGDTVMWESQSAGHRKSKTGVIVDVIPSNKSITWIHVDKYINHIVMFDWGQRKGESYLVEVEIKGSEKSKLRLYRPRVKHLRKIN